MLEAIAEGWDVALTDEQTDEIVDRLVVEMTDAAGIRIILQRLGDVERQALAFVVAQGQVRAHVMTRKYGGIRRLGPGRLEWQKAWRDPVSPVEHLWFLGLLHREYGLDSVYPGEVLFVPPDLQGALPPMKVVLPAFHVERVPKPPITRDDRDALARDVFAVLAHLRKNSVRAKRGVLAKHEFAKLRPRLAASEQPQRMRFLHHICEEAGLILRGDGVWRPSDEAARWLKDGALARRRALYHTWLEDRNWNDLCMVPQVVCEDTGWQSDPVLARRGILDHLLACPTDAWLRVTSLADSIHDVDPDFMRPDGDYKSWYIRDARTGHYLMGYDNWDKVEGALIRYLIEYPLYWLGVVAIGYLQGKDRASCFRLTDSGAAIVGRHEPDEAPVQQMIVRSNLRVTVPLTASWYDRYLLERFARWESEEHGTARYVIDDASVRACLARGVSVNQIRAFLHRATGDRVPAAALRSIKSWAQVEGRPGQRL